MPESGLAQLGGKAVFASAAQLSPQLRQAACSPTDR